MPGGGKSSIGKLLARRLAVSFLDVDATIEQSVGGTIASVFEREGEAAFRRRESEVLAELVQRGDAPAVVATGGGVVLSAANRELLRHRTRSRLPVCAAREAVGARAHEYATASVARRRSLRALVRAVRQRDPLYREVASIVVETGRSPMRSIVDDIVTQLEQAGILSPGESPTSDTDRSRALP